MSGSRTRVASKANVSDMPSRGALEEMAAVLRRVQPDFSLADDVPVVFPDVSPGWLERAAAIIQAAARKRSRRAGRSHGWASVRGRPALSAV